MDGETATRQDERLQFGARVVAPENAAPEVHLPQTLRAPSPPVPTSSLTPLAKLGPVLRRSFDSELEHGTAFVFVPVFIALGALFYFAAPSEPGIASLLLATGLLAALSLALANRPGLRMLCLAVVIALTGVLAAKFETWRAGTQMLGSEISTRLTGRVVRIEQQASGRIRLTLDVIATERPVLRYAPDRVRATARAVPETLRPGDAVQGLVRLMPASGPVRPQSYDFAFNSYFDGIGAVGFFLRNPELVESEHEPGIITTAAAWVEGWRTRMAQDIAASIGGPEGAIAAALITGIRAGIPEEMNEALRVVGLYHVISISGLHMALVAGTVMFGLRTAFALAPGFSSRQPAKKYAAFGALAATAAYLVISGAGIAAQRSFTMLAVMLLAVMVDRAALTMRNLAISAVIILLIAPHEVMGPSFHMSFAATAALVAAYAAWASYRERRTPRRQASKYGPVRLAFTTGMKYVSGLSLTSVVAGLATALFTAWHFQQVSPLGLVANLAAMPFVSAIVMPAAVFACLLMPFGLEGPALYAMGLGISAMNSIALWLAERSAFDATGAIPLSAVLVLTAALAILTMAGSALRWAALPLLVAGAFLIATRQLPHVYVSEDARLAAVDLGDGRLAVNRPRPSTFTFQNWQRAANAGDVARPLEGDTEPPSATPADDQGALPFQCREGLCVARHGSGATIVHADGERTASTACSYASLIVIDDATANSPCRGSSVTVITKRDLARRGSAEIVFEKDIAGETRGTEASSGTEAGVRNRTSAKPALHPKIRFAIREPYRPWHAHRQYSREARGLPPWQKSQGE